MLCMVMGHIATYDYRLNLLVTFGRLLSCKSPYQDFAGNKLRIGTAAVFTTAGLGDLGRLRCQFAPRYTFAFAFDQTGST